MINGFVRWLEELRYRNSSVKGSRRNRRRTLAPQPEVLERRLVLTSLHMYSQGGPYPVETWHDSGLGYTFTVYEDLTGNGVTDDDVPFDAELAVFSDSQQTTEGEIEVEPNRYVEHDSHSYTITGHKTVHNGGHFDSHTEIVYDDLVQNGFFDDPGFDNSPYFMNGAWSADHIISLHAYGDQVDMTNFFPAGQTWVETGSSSSETPSGTQIKVAFVRQFTVRGKAYEDMNGNGHLDEGEAPFQADVYLDQNLDGIENDPGAPGFDNSGVACNADGTFEVQFRGHGAIGFGTENDDKYLKLTQGFQQFFTPGLTQPDDALNNVVFGVFQTAPVQGYVFNDINGDGTWDPPAGDRAVPDIPITIKQNGKTYTTVTNINGHFSVYLGPGSYEVTQDLSQIGVQQSVPTPPGGFTGTISTSGQVMPQYRFGRTLGKDVAVSAATRSDAKGVDFTWQSTSLTTSFDVAVFRSADPVWDAGDVQIAAAATFTPGSGVKVGSGRFDFAPDYVHDPGHPYLIAVADPFKHIGESNETNNAFVVQRIIDLSPFKVTGGFTYDAPNDQFVSNGPARVGFKPLINEAFVPLVGGNITYDADKIKVTGLVTTDYGYSPVGLFEGNVTINVHSGGVSSLNVVSGVWELAGCRFAFDAFSLVNPDGGSVLDSYLNVQGSLITPDGVGLFKVQFAEPNFIHFGPRAHGISATITLTDQAVLLGDLLTLQASGASISYLATTEANPEGAFRIQGKFVVKNQGLTSYDDAQASLDISGPNFIEFGKNGLFFVGQFGASYWTIIPGFLKLKAGTVFLDTIHHEWKGDGELEMKPLTDKTLLFGAGYYDHDFNYIRVGLNNLNIPTFMDGIFLDKISLSVDGLAGKKKNAQQELVPIEVSATLGLSEGPKIQIPAVPLFNVDAHPAAIATLDVTGIVSTERVNGSVLFTYMDPNLLSLTGSFDWNWKKTEAKLSGGISALLGTVTGAAAITVNQRGVTGSANLTGLLRIPKGDGLFYAPIADVSFRGYFQALNGAESYAAFAADVTLPVIGRKSITAKVTIDKGVEYFFGDMVSLENLPAQPQSATFFATAFAAPQAQEAAAGSDTFTVPSGTQHLLVSATWANELDDAKLELVRPDGTIMTESELDEVNAALIPEMTSSTSRAIALLNPMAGEWQIRVVSAADPGETQYAALRDAPEPTIEVLDAQVTSDGVTIQYTATDIYPDATVALFYDTDKTGFDGLSMIENLPVSGAPTTYHWDLTHSFSGTYYIYAVITDAQGNVQFQYLDTPVTVDADPPASSVTVLSDVTNTSSFTLSWSGSDDTNGSGLASYDIFVSDNGGDYTLFLGNTTQTTAQFNGEFGHKYAFYSVATDATGRIEETPVTADAQTVTAAPGNRLPDVLDAVFSLAENSALNTPVGAVSATDPDVDDTLTYSITGGNTSGAFAINASTGAVTVANPAALDFETTPTFSLTVQVADNHGATDTATVQVNLTDANDAPQSNIGGSAVTWIKKQPAVVVLPQVTVSGANLAGGTLTLSLNSPGKKKPFDALSLLSSTALGTTTGLQFANGHLTLQIHLGQTATAAAIQAFLRGIKFTTKGGGLKSLTRTLTVTLANASEQSSLISQTINVKKKP